MEIKVVKKVLAANDAIAEDTRAFFREKGIFALNLMGSPGSGKTAILERTVEQLSPGVSIGVIEGDITEKRDAERLSRFGIPISQINTGPFGGQCHLEASWIKSAARELPLDELKLLFIENIGNLVCPAEFATGAHKNAVVLSTPEGEDKPLKYPLMFRVSDVLIVNKTDLLPHLSFDVDLLIMNAKRVNSNLEILKLSAMTGDGMKAWTDWLLRNLSVANVGRGGLTLQTH